MSSTVSVHTLLFSITINLFTSVPSIKNQHYNNSFDEFFLRNFNRTRRHMTQTSVCSELNKVEDTPFIALVIIHESGRLQCIGTIIDQYHVLSARDCYREKDISSLMVVAGYASPYFGRHSQVKFVHKIAIHPKVPLVILVLSKPFSFTKTVQPIRVIGPKRMSTGTNPFGPSYESFKPYLVAGFQFPTKFTPLRGDLIPRGMTYQLKIDDKTYGFTGGPVTCDTQCGKGGVTCPEIDKTYNICTTGKSEFCWTALGSPTMIMVDKKAVQIGLITFAKCRYLASTPAPETPEQDRLTEYSPYIHIRLDWFWKWIKANSLVEQATEI